MDSIKISELTAGTAASSTTDIGVFVQGGSTVRGDRSVMLLPVGSAITMAGDMTLSYATYPQQTHIVDPDGADRNLTLDTDYPAYFEKTIVNDGEELVVVNPLTLNVALSYGEKQKFIFTGTSWR